MKKIAFLTIPLLALTFFTSCKDEDMVDDTPTYEVNDPDQADKIPIDRFSDAAGTLFQRSANSALPAANAAVNFDQPPFITKGLGPAGEMVEYYNFDVQSTEPAPIWVLFREGETMPVDGQLNIIDVVPGDAGYNDFWHVHKVTVPSDYVANTASSKADIDSRGFTVEETNMLVNCPVVPEGSTAGKRLGNGSNGLVRGWYNDEVVFYFSFEEKALQPTNNGMVPLSPIYVAFNKNPDPNDPTSGPPSGFVTEPGTMQTHNVLATTPSSGGYSPLWSVNVYDNMDFGNVMDWATATAATTLAMDVAHVNCPVVVVN